MPQMLIPMIGPLLGGLLGGGDPDKTTTKQTQEMIEQLTQSTTQQSGTKQFDTFDEAVEDPRFAAFRQGLLPQFNQELNRAQRPIFGEGQKAGTLQDINAQFAGISDQLSSQAAARGQLGSGLLPHMELQAQLAGAGQRAGFLSQLPMLEEQSRRQAVGGLLGQGMQFAGRAPISRRQRGVEEFESFTDAQERMQREATGGSRSVESTAQPGLGGRILGTVAGIATQGGFNPAFNRIPGVNLPLNPGQSPLGRQGGQAPFELATPDFDFTTQPGNVLNQPFSFAP